MLDFVDRYAALGEKLYIDAGLRRKLTPYARVRFAEAKGVTGAQLFAGCAPPCRIHPLHRKGVRELRCPAGAHGWIYRAGDQIGRSRRSASRRWSHIRWRSISPAIPQRQFPAALLRDARRPAGDCAAESGGTGAAGLPGFRTRLALGGTKAESVMEDCAMIEWRRVLSLLVGPHSVASNWPTGIADGIVRLPAGRERTSARAGSAELG